MTVTYMFRTKSRAAESGQTPAAPNVDVAPPVMTPPPFAVGQIAARHEAQGHPPLPVAEPAAAAHLSSPASLPAAAAGSVARYVRSEGRIILVAKARGGIGATTLAVNLALEMQMQASRRHREVGGRVALVDLDVQLGNAASFLDLADRGGMLALARLGPEPDGQAVRHALMRHPSGLSVLAAPSGSMPFEAFDVRRIASILDALAEAHDVVIVDLPPALIGWLDPVLARAERLLMVTDLAVPSITRARRIVGLMTEGHPDLPVEIVVAHERRPFRPGQLHRDAATALGHDLHHWLPDEAKLARQALDRGEPLVQLAPRSAYCKAVKTIAAHLASPGTSAASATTRKEH